MEVEVDEKVFKAAGAELFPDDRRGLRIHGWEIETRNRSILTSSAHELWEKNLETCHLPEMVFGDSCLVVKHVKSGTTIHFNAFDALIGWKKEALPPVEVPAAAKWKFRCKPFEQVILDYDYTFTTPYCGSETITSLDADKNESGEISKETCNLHWEDCKEKIDVVALASKEPILFYDEVVLYEDELADNGVSLLTVKVRVMPSGWFLLLRFWLRVDGVLMRLRETRMHCAFDNNVNPIILRESCWRETTFQALAAKGYPSDAAAYNDPSIVCQRLPVVLSKTQKLKQNGSEEATEPAPKIAKLNHNDFVSDTAAVFFRVKKLSEKAVLPSRGSPLSAGYDLSSATETKIPARGKALVPTDLSIAVPGGTYARIAPRSGMALKHSIEVGAGVIDADYRGPVGVILFNHSDSDFEVNAGDRIAELIIEKIITPDVMEVEDLDCTVRGEGGFGSTGI